MNFTAEINEWIEKNSERILEELSGLIQIRTINNPPGGNERPGQEYLYNILSYFIPEEDIDIFEIDEIEGIRKHPLFFPTMDGIFKEYKNRPNIVAKIKSPIGGKSMVFSGHMDVMPVKEKKWGVFTDPFSGKIKDGKMYGRGTMDMKAGTFAGFMALKCIKELGVKLNGDIYAESVVDEENGGVNGTIAARLRNPDIDFAILAEPTGLVAGIETIGGTDWKAEVKVSGPGGISFGHELANPVYRLAKIAMMLEKYDSKIKRIKVPTTYTKEQFIRLLTYQIYSGGSSYNESGAVPLSGHIYFWLESFAGTDERKYIKEFLDFAEKDLGKYPEFKNEFPVFKPVIRYLEGHKTSIDHPAMDSLKKAYSELGLKYYESGLGFSCDAFAFKKTSKTNIVVLGPEGGNAHGIDEWVDIKSFFDLLKIMVLTAVDYCS